MFHPSYILGFSALLMWHSKASFAGHGHSLVKNDNIAVGHQQSALRVRLSAYLDSVTPFAKGITIAFKVRLASYADRRTDSLNIRWMEH